MPGYVYQVKVELNNVQATHYPDEAKKLSRETILFKNQRKAEKFVMNTILTWCADVRLTFWMPEDQTWCVDSNVSSARCTFRILEIKVRT